MHCSRDSPPGAFLSLPCPEYPWLSLSSPLALAPVDAVELKKVNSQLPMQLESTQTGKLGSSGIVPVKDLKGSFIQKVDGIIDRFDIEPGGLREMWRPVELSSVWNISAESMVVKKRIGKCQEKESYHPRTEPASSPCFVSGWKTSEGNTAVSLSTWCSFPKIYLQNPAVRGGGTQLNLQSFFRKRSLANLRLLHRPTRFIHNFDLIGVINVVRYSQPRKIYLQM